MVHQYEESRIKGFYEIEETISSRIFYVEINFYIPCLTAIIRLIIQLFEISLKAQLCDENGSS